MKYLGLLFLLSCAAALVPETKDPIEKLNWATHLISNRRGIPAEKLIREAEAIFRERGDREGLARCHYSSAYLYRSNASHPELKLPDNHRAGREYLAAAKLYEQLNQHKLAAQSVGLGAMFVSLGKKAGKGSEGCQIIEANQKRFGMKSSEAKKMLEEDWDRLKCHKTF